MFCPWGEGTTTMSKFSPAARERAVRMVLERRAEHPSLWAAVESTARIIGCVPQTLLEWVKHFEAGTGECRKKRTDPEARIQQLEQEIEQLRQANKLLQKVFAAETRLELPEATNVPR